MEVSLTWDSREITTIEERVSLMVRKKISLPINSLLINKLVSSSNAEVALYQFTMLFPKTKLVTVRKTQPIFAVHFNHLEERIFNEFERPILHVFPPPMPVIDLSAAPKILTYNYEPSNINYLPVLKHVPSSFEIGITIGHSFREFLDLNECYVYLRLRYKFDFC